LKEKFSFPETNVDNHDLDELLFSPIFFFGICISLFFLLSTQPTAGFHTTRACSGNCTSRCGDVASVAGVCVPLRQVDQPNTAAWLISCSGGSMRMGGYTNTLCSDDALVFFDEQNVATCHALQPNSNSYVSFTCATSTASSPMAVGDITGPYTLSRIIANPNCNGMLIHL
jgi:hypothetical protein